jgi:hypothetical protein
MGDNDSSVAPRKGAARTAPPRRANVLHFQAVPRRLPPTHQHAAAANPGRPTPQPALSDQRRPPTPQPALTHTLCTYHRSAPSFDTITVHPGANLQRRQAVVVTVVFCPPAAACGRRWSAPCTRATAAAALLSSNRTLQCEINVQMKLRIIMPLRLLVPRTHLSALVCSRAAGRGSLGLRAPARHMTAQPS